MEASGILWWSYSPWAAPVVLVKKKDESMHVCVDCLHLNKVTVKDAYPLARLKTHWILPVGTVRLRESLQTDKRPPL